LFLGEAFNFCAVLDDYDLGKILGEGGFGRVHIAVHRETKREYAIKIMDIAQTRKLHAALFAITLFLQFKTPKRCRISTRKPRT
jgi:serine/threonine protein kinase